MICPAMIHSERRAVGAELLIVGLPRCRSVPYPRSSRGFQTNHAANRPGRLGEATPELGATAGGVVRAAVRQTSHTVGRAADAMAGLLARAARTVDAAGAAGATAPVTDRCFLTAGTAICRSSTDYNGSRRAALRDVGRGLGRCASGDSRWRDRWHPRTFWHRSPGRHSTSRCRRPRCSIGQVHPAHVDEPSPGPDRGRGLPLHGQVGPLEHKQRTTFAARRMTL
jgi:hypothetical protein